MREKASAEPMGLGVPGIKTESAFEVFSKIPRSSCLCVSGRKRHILFSVWLSFSISLMQQCSNRPMERSGINSRGDRHPSCRAMVMQGQGASSDITPESVSSLSSIQKMMCGTFN